MIIDKYKIDKYEDSSSRYKSLWRVIDDSGEAYQETYDKIEIPISESDSYCEIDPSNEDRLDLVSHAYYGTPLLWWVIAEASNILNPLDVPVGTVVRIPSKASLYGIGGVML